MDAELDIEETIRKRLFELDTLVTLVKNGAITLSDELKIRYLNRIDEIMAELNVLKIQRAFNGINQELPSVTF